MPRKRGTFSRPASARNPKAAFYLALAFLVWSIIPHFHLYHHSHGAEASGHTSLTRAEFGLANRMLEDLGPAGLANAASEDLRLEESPSAETGAGESPFSRGPAPDGIGLTGQSILGDADRGIRHTHSGQDANLAGASSLPVLISVPPAGAAHPADRYLPPGLRPSGCAHARGPPSALRA